MHPSVRSGETEVSVYFPGDDTLWYDIETYKVYQGPGYQGIAVAIDKVIGFLSLGFKLFAFIFVIYLIRFLYFNEAGLLSLKRSELDEHLL